MEQAIGNLIATNLLMKGVTDVNALNHMPHEDRPQEEIMSVDDAMEKGLEKLV